MTHANDRPAFTGTQLNTVPGLSIDSCQSSNIDIQEEQLDSRTFPVFREVVFGQEDKPNAPISACNWLASSVHRIIHHNLPLKHFKRRRAQLLSEANHVARLTP